MEKLQLSEASHYVQRATNEPTAQRLSCLTLSHPFCVFGTLAVIAIVTGKLRGHRPVRGQPETRRPFCLYLELADMARPALIYMVTQQTKPVMNMILRRGANLRLSWR